MEVNNKPLITVVTVCYNAVNELEKTMLSVLDQTYEHIEYIVIDGGSKDGTIDIIRKYADKLAYWVSEPDKGIYDAMNKGIRAAKGKWINFMNAGDRFVDKRILSNMLNKITLTHYNPRIIRGNIIRVYPKFQVKSHGVTSQNPGLMDMFNNTFHHQACLIQTSLFKEFGYYSTEYRLVSDWKFFFDCVVLHHVPTNYVDLTVACFEMDGASSVNTVKCIEERESYLKKLYGRELFTLLDELNIYRKSSLIRLYYKSRCYLMNHISDKTFNRLLTCKRFVRKFFGLNVN